MQQDLLTHSDSIGVGHYLGVLRRRWGLVVALTVLGALAGVLTLQLVPVRVTATTTVSMSVISAEPFNGSRSAASMVDHSTEEVIAGSSAVAQAATDLLDGRQSAAQLREGSEVVAAEDATILRISYTADSAQSATEGADALATAYLNHRSEAGVRRLAALRDSITLRMEELRPDLVAANTAFESAEPGSAERVRANSERQLIQAEIDSLLEQRADLARVEINGGELLSPADGEELAYSPRPVLVVSSGVAAGLGIGLVLAFLVHARDGRLRSASEVEERTGLRVLVDLSRVSGADDAVAGFREARERILARGDAGGAVAVVDMSHGEGHLDVPVGLATALGECGPRPDVVIASGAPADRDALSGPAPGGGGGPVQTPRSLLVVPPGVPPATVLAVGRSAQSAVLIAERGRTTVAELLHASHEMQGLGTQVIGVLLVPVELPSPPAAVPTQEVPGPDGSTEAQRAMSTVE